MPIKASLVMVLLVVGFTSIAAADSAPPSQADLAFLASIAEAPELPGTGTPAPQPTACTVSNDCGDGNVVSCTGDWSCETTISGVKCDGNEVQCPNYCSIGMQCDCCTGPQTVFCWSKKGDCQVTSEGITCDGHTMTCENTCPLCPEW